MSEPTYGSGGQSYDSGQQYGGAPGYASQQHQQQQGYGQQPQYGGQQAYGGPPSSPGQPAAPAGYGGGYSAPAPTSGGGGLAPALIAQITLYIGYAAAALGLLGFILFLTVDLGDGALKFAYALGALVTGAGFAGLNLAASALVTNSLKK